MERFIEDEWEKFSQVVKDEVQTQVLMEYDIFVTQEFILGAWKKQLPRVICNNIHFCINIKHKTHVSEFFFQQSCSSLFWQ